MTQQRGDRFLAAFNDIEGHFRAVLRAGDHVDFGQLVRDYTAKKRLPYQYVDALRVCASLRNAISHGRFYEGRPIADPVEYVVVQIELLREQILAPQKAYVVLGPMNVRVARPADPIAAVLEHVRRFDYSQLPIYDDNGYVGILTTNTIARWLADQFGRNTGMAEEEPVRKVMGFAEPHESARLVPRTITAAEAIDRLSHGGAEGRPLTALIITDRGKATETPLAVVVADDLPALSAALAIS